MAEHDDDDPTNEQSDPGLENLLILASVLGRWHAQRIMTEQNRLFREMQNHLKTETDQAKRDAIERKYRKAILDADYISTGKSKE